MKLKDFHLLFFDESYRKQLGYLGTASGKNENKIEKAKLTVEHENGFLYLMKLKQLLYVKNFMHNL